MSDAMIDVQGLTKVYGSTPAVNAITFSVHPGEVVGFLGPNGAGKSTTMKMLTCYMTPTSGTARVAGLDVFDHSLEVRKRIGYLPENNPLYDDMTPVETLEFFASVREVPHDRRAARIKEMIAVCGLGAVLGKTVAELSKGYRQRLGLAQALLHDPEILVLDEPTSGLDPNQIVEIRSLIREIGKQKTIILSTHILPEVQATCGRVIIIHEGKLVADGTPEELQRSQQGDRYRLEIEGAGADLVQLEIKKIDGVLGVQSHAQNGAVALDLTGKVDTDLRRPLFKLAVDKGWTLLELRREQASLEDVFRRLTRE